MILSLKQIVLLGAGVHSLGIIRSYGNLKDYEIHVIYSNKNNFAQSSKYVYRREYVNFLSMSYDNYVLFLINYVKKNKLKKPLLIPTADEYLEIVSKNCKKLSKYYSLFTQDYDVVGVFLEKEKTYKLCKKLNIEHPKTFYPKNLLELKKYKDKIEFPLIIKPVLSHLMVRAFNQKLLKVDNYDELIDKFKLCLDKKIDVMISEYIPGNDSCMFTYCAIYSKEKKFVGEFMFNTLRQTPPNFGVSRVAVSINVDKNVREASRKLFEFVGFSGYAGIQFKKDPRTGMFKLIEVNCRTIRPMILQTECGFNSLKMLYEIFAENKKSVSSSAYTVGVYYIELYAEFISYLLRRSQEDFTFSEYRLPYKSKKKVYADYDKNDMRPFFKMISNLPMKYIRQVIR